MPDIAMRFHKDMLVLSAPLEAVLERQGVQASTDMGYLTLVEPEALQDALRMEKLAGAQCLVAPSEGVTPARLAHQGLDERGAEVAIAALQIVRSLKPQHVLAEIGPCGLPLDGSSKASLNEDRSQYARAAHCFDGQQLDALFLTGFHRADDLKCALMGVRQVTDAPIFASVTVDGEGALAQGRQTFEEALEVMAEYGASVAGFETAAPTAQAVAVAKRAVAATNLPVLAQLQVAKRNPRQGAATPENPYYCADTLVEAAALLRAAGVQFLRATGDATPAYTGALAATTTGFDVAPASAARAEAEDEEGAQA